VGGRAIKVSEEVYEKLSELAKRYGSFSINEVIEKLLNNQCVSNSRNSTSGNQRFENTVEKLGSNTQLSSTEYTITVSGDIYNALEMLRIWFIRASGRDVTLEDVIGVLITYWTLRQTRQ
jgi:predicted CopG family antitoxin